MKQNITLFLCLICISFYSQFDYLKSYIPYDTCNFTTHPIIEFRIWVHIVQKNENDPQNFTKNNLELINQHFKWINNIYSTLSPPTLTNSKGNKPYIRDSRIRFHIDTITFHVNEHDWDRLKIVQEGINKRIKILEINSDSNSILIKGLKTRYKPIIDSISIKETKFNDGLIHVKNIKKSGANTLICTEEEIFISEDSSGYIYGFNKINNNCSKDNWEKYTNKNKDYIHVFYTGSSLKGSGFGCGPSPFFLNISKAIYKGKYAKAQLIAHELGHCMGLNHTNFPQFNDLPSSDKFGWIDCNEKNTSNNIMGGNKCRRYLSPLQIGYIHYRYSNIDELFNSIYKPYDDQIISYIRKNTIWEKSVFSQNNIVVKKNKTLEIKDKLVMGENTTIFLEKKSELIIDGGKIKHNGKRWNGIIKCRNEYKKKMEPILKKNMPTIKIVNNGEIVY